MRHVKADLRVLDTWSNCPFRGDGFGPQHLHDNSILTISPVQKDPMPSLTPQAPDKCMTHIYTSKKNTHTQKLSKTLVCYSVDSWKSEMIMELKTKWTSIQQWQIGLKDLQGSARNTQKNFKFDPGKWWVKSQVTYYLHQGVSLCHSAKHS